MRPHAFLQPLRFKAHQDQVQYKWPTDFMIVVDLQILFLKYIVPNKRLSAKNQVLMIVMIDDQYY